MATRSPEEKRRDEILSRLLKTPPQPRPERDRGKGEEKKEGDPEAAPSAGSEEQKP